MNWIITSPTLPNIIETKNIVLIRIHKCSTINSLTLPMNTIFERKHFPLHTLVNWGSKRHLCSCGSDVRVV